MSLLNWFKALATGKQDAALSAADKTDSRVGPGQGANDEDEEGAVIAGLNFKTAIDAHMKWKVRLEHCIDSDNEESLQVETVSRDDQCVLGKWIHGIGNEQFGHLREFQEMKMEHASFHLSAGDVLTCCMAGDKDGASQRLRSGDYTRASERVKLQLARLYVKVSAQN